MFVVCTIPSISTPWSAPARAGVGFRCSEGDSTIPLHALGGLTQGHDREEVGLKEAQSDLAHLKPWPLIWWGV